MDEIIRKFIENMETQTKKQPMTIKRYSTHTQHFLEFIAPKTYDKVETEDLLRYMKHCEKLEGKSKSSIQSYIAAIKYFYKYLLVTKQIKYDPTSISSYYLREFNSEDSNPKMMITTEQARQLVRTRKKPLDR